MTYDRKVAEAKYGGSYVRMPGPKSCVYCASRKWMVYDHVPPLRLADSVPESDRKMWRSCWACNAHLGMYPVTCLDRRAVFVLEKLRAEWLYARAGLQRIAGCAEIERRGKSIVARRAGGKIAQRCGCSRCQGESLGLAKNQDLGEG